MSCHPGKACPENRAVRNPEGSCMAILYMGMAAGCNIFQGGVCAYRCVREWLRNQGGLAASCSSSAHMPNTGAARGPPTGATALAAATAVAYPTYLPNVLTPAVASALPLMLPTSPNNIEEATAPTSPRKKDEDEGCQETAMQQTEATPAAAAALASPSSPASLQWQHGDEDKDKDEDKDCDSKQDNTRWKEGALDKRQLIDVLGKLLVGPPGKATDNPNLDPEVDVVACLAIINSLCDLGGSNALSQPEREQWQNLAAVLNGIHIIRKMNQLVLRNLEMYAKQLPKQHEVGREFHLQTL